MKLIDHILNKTKLSANRRKVMKNVYWAVLGKVVNIVCGLLVGIMVARYLGPENFGLMNYVISYVTLFSVLAAFGLDNIEIRELSKSGSVRNTIMGSAFAIRLVFALITVILIFVTLVLFESDRFTFTMIMVYSLTLIVSSLNVIRNYFTSIILNEYVVKTEISRTLIGSSVNIVFLLNQCSLGWFIAAATFNFFLVGGGYIFSYHKKDGRIRDWRVDYSVIKMLIQESFPMMLSGAAIIIYTRINEVMIRNMLDNASVGQFSVAAKITELAVFIPLMIAQTVTPLLVQAHQTDMRRYREKCQQFMDIMVWSAIAVSAGLSLMAGPAIRILFGESYLRSIPVVQVLAWKAVFSGLGAASGQMIIIEKLQRYAVVRNIMGCIISVMLNFMLIPSLGIVGSAIATLLSVAFAGYISHIFIGPYRYLLPIQSKAILFGWKQMLRLTVLWR